MRDEVLGRLPESAGTRPTSSAMTVAPRDPQLGALLIEEGFISESQLQEALKIQSELASL